MSKTNPFQYKRKYLLKKYNMGSQKETTKLQYSWILWYHDPENKDYSLESYVKIADISTPQQFWTVVDSISKEAWESGMFFFMRRGFKPLWDAPENEAGGTWSKKKNIPDSNGQMVIQNQVDKATFDQYIHTLKVMAQLSRILVS